MDDKTIDQELAELETASQTTSVADDAAHAIPLEHALRTCIFTPPADPEPFTFVNGTVRTPLADVSFELGTSGIYLTGSQIVDERNAKRGRTIQLRLPNKGKAGGYAALIVGETEIDKARLVAFHAAVVKQFLVWRKDQVKKGITVRPSEVRPGVYVPSDDDLVSLGLTTPEPAKS